MSVEIVGPFQERRLVINGWRVPMMEAVECDGGTFNLIIDNRLALHVDAVHFDRVAQFVADVIGVCFGYGAHPNSDEWYADAGLDNPFEDRAQAFRNVPHPVLAPSRVMEITGVVGDGEESS